MAALQKTLLTAFAIALIAALTVGSAWARTAGQDQWTGDRDMLLFFDAVGKINKHSYKQPSRSSIVSQSLKAYLKRLDPYSQFLTADEYAEFRKLQSPRYSGVGMEIATGKRGRIICLPYPGGPAHRAGIRGGDILLSVGGESVRRKSLPQIASLIRGKPDTMVTMVLRTAEEKTKKVRVLRAKMPNTSVTKDDAAGLPLVRVIRFTNTTPSEMRRALSGLADKPGLILDLRGNPGGDLASAVDCAALFLAKGKTIVELKGPQEKKVYKSTDVPAKLPRHIYIWQDGRTASAAEVFIAALTENQRAVSLGRPTFGKALRQKIIGLLDGSALFISDARILPPSGNSYHDQGLKPHHQLKGRQPGREAYEQQTKKLYRAAQPEAAKPGGLKVRVQTKSAPTRSAEPTPAVVFVACFEKKYMSKREAQVFSTQVQHSVDNGTHYLIRLQDGRYRVCAGPYPIRSAAEDAQQEMEIALGKPKMFVLSVPPTALQNGATAEVAVASKKPARPTKGKAAAPAAPQAESWGLSVGYFEAKTARDSALSSLAALAGHGLKGWVEFKGFKTKKEAEAEIAFFTAKGYQAKWLAPCAQGPDKCLVRYWVYSGPYPKKDEALKARLVKEDKLPKDSNWKELH